MFRDKAAKFRIGQFGKPDSHTLQCFTIGWQIIARQNSERLKPRCMSSSDSLNQKTGRRSRCLRVLQIVDNIAVALIQRTAGRGVAIAFFGHRERNNTDIRLAHGVQHGFRIFRCDQNIGETADNLQLFTGTIAHDNTIEIILRGECISGVGTAQ